MLKEKNEESVSLKKANRIILKHVMWTMASAVIPIHVVDVLGIVFIQNDMMKQLCKLYDFDYQQNVGKSIVASLITSSSAKGISLVFSKMKVVDKAVLAATSAAFTYALGRLFISNFEKGISLVDIDLKAGEELFNEYFEKGKEVVTNMK